MATNARPLGEAGANTAAASAGGGSFSEIPRFVLVGIVNTAVDLLVLNTLILLTHTGTMGLSFTVLKTVSFLTAVVNSYFLNCNWTFRQRNRRKGAAQVGGLFLLVSIFGAVVNIGAASYIATFVSPLGGLQRSWPSVAALAGTACGFTLNFLGYKYIVFSARDTFIRLAIGEQPEPAEWQTEESAETC